MLKGKIAIVTGGTKGIGKGIADELKKRGAKVIVSARKKVKTKHHFITCDVTDKHHVKSMVDEVIKKYKKIDILVNNAGIYPFNDFKKMKEEDWDQVINCNLKGIFYCTKAATTHMMKKKYGKIINIASIAGVEVGFPGLVHYCTTKAGVMGFTRALALEMAPYNINVNAIAPGVIITPGVLKGLDKKTIAYMAKTIPKGRTGKPKDIANAVAFLAEDTTEFITGQTIVVDGGHTTKLA